MDNEHSTFLASEFVKLCDRATLKDIQFVHSLDRDVALAIQHMLPKNMANYAEQRVCITSVSYYHMGWVLYELEGLPDFWPESALMDPGFEQNSPPLNRPASDVYKVFGSEEDSTIEIRDTENRLYCRLKKHNPKIEAENIRRVAYLRTVSSFATRYQFDGIEFFEDSILGLLNPYRG